MRTQQKQKSLDPRSLYTGQTLFYKGQHVTVVEVESSGQVCIELPGGQTLWVNPKNLSLSLS